MFVERHDVAGADATNPPEVPYVYLRVETGLVRARSRHLSGTGRHGASEGERGSKGAECGTSVIALACPLHRRGGSAGILCYTCRPGAISPGAAAVSKLSRLAPRSRRAAVLGAAQL